MSFHPLTSRSTDSLAILRTTLRCFLIACLALPANPLSAQWVQTHGPYGGILWSLAGCLGDSGKNVVLARSESGALFVSTDDAASWRRTQSVPDSVYLRGIAALNATDSAGPAHLFTATTNGVFRSLDEGAHWIRCGLAGNDVYSIASFPAGIRKSILLAAGNRGIFRSTNLGDTWQKCDLGRTYSMGLYPLVTLSPPGNPGKTDLFGWTGDNMAFLHSTDAGESWVSVIANVTPMPRLYALAAVGGELFAGTDKGLFRSTDLGENWALADSNVFPVVPVEALCTIEPRNAEGRRYLLAGTYGKGVLLSRDAGVRWERLNTGLPSKFVHALQVIPTTSGTDCFCLSNTGIAKLEPHSLVWVPADEGLIDVSVYGLAKLGGRHDGKADRLLAATWSGFFLSDDEGGSWPLHNNGLNGVEVASVAVGGGNVYAGTAGHGIYASSDSGESWTSIGLTDCHVSGLVVVGSDLIAGTWRGVFRSTDSGHTWSKTLDHAVWSIAQGPDESGSVHLYAGTQGGTMDGVYVSADSGKSWSATSLTWDFSTVATRGTDVFAAQKGGFRGMVRDTTTGALSFKMIGSVFLSKDQGKHWRKLGLSGIRVQAFAFPDSSIIAAGGGIFRSSDQGETWLPYDQGLPSNAVEALVVSGSFIYAGTRNAGVWRRSLIDKP